MAKKKTTAADPPYHAFEVLQSSTKEELAALLAELASKHPEVEARVARHALSSDPVRLAAEFRRRLQTWRRAQRFLARSAATAFGRDLESWVDEIERELLPLDPARAHALADAFVRSDECFFEQADDSDGAIGDAVRAGCCLWLRAAKAYPGRSNTDWIEPVYALEKADDYGAREALLRHADLLFDESGLRALAGRFEVDLNRALRTRGGNKSPDYAVFKAAAAIGLVADALRDPDLSTNATLRYSPSPNRLQKAKFAERYIRFGRPSEALAWLEGDWEGQHDQRDRLLAEAYAAMGDAVHLRAVRRALFERTGSPIDFEAWHASLNVGDRASAVEDARQLAQSLEDPISGAQLFLTLKDDPSAEALLIARYADVRGERYGTLLPLAETLKKKRRLLGAVVCYRALLVGILARAYARAYSHAAEYLRELRQLDQQVQDYCLLPTHDAFETSLRSAHARKVSFWGRVN